MSRYDDDEFTPEEIRDALRNKKKKLDKRKKKALLKKRKSDLSPMELKLYKRLKAKSRKKKRRVILIIEIIVILLLVGVFYVWSKLGKINFTKIGKTEKNDLDEETEQLLHGYTNIALFGIDNRSNGNFDTGNSDALMVASINNDTKEVRIVSIYRDSFLDMDGDGKLRKCNYAYNHPEDGKKGPQEAIDMINRNLDLDIEDYVTVDFKALVDAVDAVGGVDINIESTQEIKYLNDYMNEVEYITGKDSQRVTKTGMQHLDGVQALCYCRIRYTSGGDFKRAARQRTVLTQIFEKAKTASAGQINEMIDGIFPEISTSLSAPELIGLATNVKSYKLAGTLGFPMDKRTATYGSSIGSVDVPCTLESNVKKVYAYLFNENDYDPSEKVKEISSEIQKYTGFDESDAVNYGDDQYATGDGSKAASSTSDDTSSDN